MTEVENDQVETGTIVQEIQAGYMLGKGCLDRLWLQFPKKV